MYWLMTFSELAPRTLEVLSQLPHNNTINFERSFSDLYVEKIILMHPHSHFIIVSLKQGLFHIDVNLHELMLNQITAYPELEYKINQPERFALRLVWLELGIKGYWGDNKEEVLMEFTNTLSMMINRTRWLFEQLHKEIEPTGRLH